jgi:hypothetical protein
MKSVLDQLDTRVGEHLGPSAVGGMDAVEDFEEEVAAPSVDPEAEKRYKLIRGMFKSDSRGAEALLTEFQLLARNAFAELVAMEPLDPQVAIVLTRFQTFQVVVQKIQSLK